MVGRSNCILARLADSRTAFKSQNRTTRDCSRLDAQNFSCFGDQSDQKNVASMKEYVHSKVKNARNQHGKSALQSPWICRLKTPTYPAQPYRSTRLVNHISKGRKDNSNLNAPANGLEQKFSYKNNWERSPRPGHSDDTLANKGIDEEYLAWQTEVCPNLLPQTVGSSTAESSQLKASGLNTNASPARLYLEEELQVSKAVQPISVRSTTLPSKAFIGFGSLQISLDKMKLLYSRNHPSWDESNIKPLDIARVEAPSPYLLWRAEHENPDKKEGFKPPSQYIWLKESCFSTNEEIHSAWNRGERIGTRRSHPISVQRDIHRNTSWPMHSRGNLASSISKHKDEEMCQSGSHDFFLFNGNPYFESAKCSDQGPAVVGYKTPVQSSGLLAHAQDEVAPPSVFTHTSFSFDLNKAHNETLLEKMIDSTTSPNQAWLHEGRSSTCEYPFLHREEPYSVIRIRKATGSSNITQINAIVNSNEEPTGYPSNTKHFGEGNPSYCAIRDDCFASGVSRKLSSSQDDKYLSSQENPGKSHVIKDDQEALFKELSNCGVQEDLPMLPKGQGITEEMEGKCSKCSDNDSSYATAIQSSDGEGTCAVP